MTLRDMTIKLTIKLWSCDRPATFARLLINLELFCQGTNVLVTSKTSKTVARFIRKMNNKNNKSTEKIQNPQLEQKVPV